MSYRGVPCPMFDEPFIQDEEYGSAKMILLDFSNLNPHNFYFMANILDKVTEEQLEISKNLGEIKEKLSKWSGMTKDSTEKAILQDLKYRVRELEEDYDSWMLELGDR